MMNAECTMQNLAEAVAEIRTIEAVVEMMQAAFEHFGGEGDAGAVILRPRDKNLPTKHTKGTK